MVSMKLVVLTSDNLRHKYIASKLTEEFDVKLIVTEKKSEAIEDTTSYNLNDAAFVKKHFDQRKTNEKFYFKNYKNFPSNVPHLKIPHKQINCDFVYDTLNLISPDLIILFGTSIIKKRILDKFQEKIINLHLGLSPYYKGSATNLFPFYYKELECIGATIHIATEKVDSGDIIHQFRPEVDINDSLHDIGNKVILKSGVELPKAINRYMNQKNNVVKQQNVKGSIICKVKDLTPNLLREIYLNLERGLVKEYIENESVLTSAKPIISI